MLLQTNLEILLFGYSTLCNGKELEKLEKLEVACTCNKFSLCFGCKDLHASKHKIRMSEKLPNLILKKLKQS